MNETDFNNAKVYDTENMYGVGILFSNRGRFNSIVLQ